MLDFTKPTDFFVKAALWFINLSDAVDSVHEIHPVALANRDTLITHKYVCFVKRVYSLEVNNVGAMNSDQIR